MTRSLGVPKIRKKEAMEKEGEGRQGEEGRGKREKKKDHINERRGILVVRDTNIILRDQPISFSFSNFYFLPLKYFFFTGLVLPVT